MAQPVQLHRRIRERREPRISASALAEFIITPPDRQDEVLHDARFMRGPAVAPYGDAMRAIRAYCADPARSTTHLDAAFEALMLRGGQTDLRPSVRDEAVRSAEAIQLFQDSANAFGLRAMPLLEVARFDPVPMHGILVSVQPDIIVGTDYPPRDNSVGGLFFRPQKRPDPNGCKTARTRLEREAFRREMGKYMLVLLRLSFIARGIPEDKIDPQLLMFLDLRIGERIGFPTDRKSRERRIKAACGQIARLWPSVEPRPGDLSEESDDY